MLKPTVGVGVADTAAVEVAVATLRPAAVAVTSLVVAERTSQAAARHISLVAHDPASLEAATVTLEHRVAMRVGPTHITVVLTRTSRRAVTVDTL